MILAGQTELWDQKLRYQRYAAIRQRVDVFCVLNHLSVSETAGYVEANLHYAGCDNPVFTDKALSEVHRISGGIPRMINRVCTNSLMYSAQQQSRLIDDHTVRFVAEHEMLSMSGVKDQ